jgi:pilus assembly protein Flp/PilA
MGTDDRGTNMKNLFYRLLGDVKGATAVEYGLIISLIVLAMVSGLQGVSNATTNKWNYIANTVLAH